MSKIFRFVALLVLVVIAGGAVLLSAWRIPAPSAKIEKVIPNDKFPR
jgi:hypothetical protein